MKALALAAMALIVIACACGGSGGGTSPGGGNPPPSSTITITTSLPPATKGQAYSAVLSASGGSGALTWVAVGALPNGLVLSSNGELTGTPQDAGMLNVSVKVTDTNSKSATKTLILDSYGFVYNLIYNPGEVNQSFYEGNYVIGGGVEPIAWSISSGTAPPGMRIHVYAELGQGGTRNASIVGVPTQSATYEFTIKAEDAATPPRIVEQNSTIVINPAQIVITTKSLPHATAGQAYSQQLQFTGGQGTYSWSLYPGSDPVPAGLNLDATSGLLHGTPAVASWSRLQVQVTDGTRQARQDLVLYVVPVALPARNDTIANATPILLPAPARSYVYSGSISPYADQVLAQGPDTDYYKFTAPAGSTWAFTVVSKDHKNQNFGVGPYALDPVLEILDENGIRFSNCNDATDDNAFAGLPVPLDTTPAGYDDPCMNNGDGSGKASAARLEMRTPGISGEVTLYLHVFDWRGYARPDMLYDLWVEQK
jgi:hypothetical protein